MADDKTLVEYMIGGVVTILSGVGIYHARKIADMPEKYMLKDDFHIAENRIREDIKGIHDRLDKLFEPK